MTSSRSSHRYSQRTLKLLWGRAAGRCAMPDCRIELFDDESSHDPIAVIGEIAHIQASSAAGPRGNTAAPPSSRDDYDNLILLCRNCHSKIDTQENLYSIEALRRIKQDHEAWVRARLPELGHSMTPWRVVILEGVHPIDCASVLNAIYNDSVVGEPTIIKVRPDRDGWLSVREQLKKAIVNLLDRGDTVDRRFAVFPLAPISACVLLGHYFTDRPHVKLFQYHRHRQSWQWETTENYQQSFYTQYPQHKRNARDIIICFEISATVQRKYLNALRMDHAAVVTLRVDRPSTGWLRAYEQLLSLGQKVHDLFEAVAQRFPNAERWHLLIAAPAPAAVRIGQALNASMVPKVQLYEFDRRAGYRFSVGLRGEP
jgi:hypothetical protein